jgi:hypothetical protein
MREGNMKEKKITYTRKKITTILMVILMKMIMMTLNKVNTRNN